MILKCAQKTQSKIIQIFGQKIFAQIFAEKFAEKLAQIFYGSYLYALTH